MYLRDIFYLIVPLPIYTGKYTLGIFHIYTKNELKLIYFQATLFMLLSLFLNTDIHGHTSTNPSKLMVA